MTDGGAPPRDEAACGARPRAVDKRFPGVHALKDVSSLEIRPHEVVGLIGENGAGKSTLMRILAGVYQPDAGEILLGGRAASPAQRRRRHAPGHRHGVPGAVAAAQPVGRREHLSRQRGAFTRFGLVRWGALYAAARGSSPRSGSTIDPRMRAADLDFATRQMVELAKALTLEEQAPGPSRHPARRADLGPRARATSTSCSSASARLKSRASFVFVSHRLDEVLELSDRVYVMKDGAVVAELPAAGADVRTLHRLMVGRGLQAEYYREPLASALPRRGRARGQGARPAGAPTATSRSSSTPARSWASPASSAPAARIWPARSPASPRTTRGELAVYGASLRCSQPRPRRSTTASATFRASGAPRASSCSSRSPPTSRSPAWTSSSASA